MTVISMLSLTLWLRVFCCSTCGVCVCVCGVSLSLCACVCVCVSLSRYIYIYIYMYIYKHTYVGIIIAVANLVFSCSTVFSTDILVCSGLFEPKLGPP